MDFDKIKAMFPDANIKFREITGHKNVFIDNQGNVSTDEREVEKLAEEGLTIKITHIHDNGNTNFIDNPQNKKLMLKNIEKRRELAELTYGKYCQPLSADEKRELENEVGSAIEGYEKALTEICQLIVDGRGLADIRNHIGRQLGEAVWDEMLTSEMVGYINSTVKAELTGKDMPEEDAEFCVDAFIRHPHLRQVLIEKENIETLRLCECDGMVCLQRVQ